MALTKGLEKYNNHKTERLSELFLNNSKYDVLFLGSSRTHTSIYPKIIDSICKVNSYNAGAEGANLFEFRLTLEAYLEHHPPPSYVVLTIDLNSFDVKRKFFNSPQYYPFVKNKKIKEALIDNGYHADIVKALPFFNITAYDDYSKGNALKGFVGKYEIPDGDLQYKGYLSNSDRELDSIRVENTIAQISGDGVASLQRIIEICKKNHTRLVFTYAPEYKFNLQSHTDDAGNVLHYIGDVAKRNNITYYRDDSLQLCSDQKLFANEGHLNRKGSFEYSTILAGKIKRLMNEN